MRGAVLVAAAAAVLSPAASAEDVATPPAPTMDIPAMIEQAAAAGIDHRYTGPWEYFVGGGAAAFDCNGDRLPDIALAGGTSNAQVYVNRSRAGGDVAFELIPDAIPPAAAKKVTGLYPIDIDNDGIRDLVALRVGENMLLKGGPDCSFALANKRFAYDGGRAWTTAFSAMFEPASAFPTLAFGNYVDRAAPGTPWGTCHDNELVRPGDTDNGAPVYDSPQMLNPGYCALSILFTDWDRSGEPALRITNDRQYYRGGEEQLWRVPPGRPARPYRSADGWQRLRIWGMGIAEADLDADGFPEYALTSMGDTKLQQLEAASEGRPTYRDIAFDVGATAHRPYTGGDFKPSTGWHAEFADLNNDGLLDLFIAKGNVEQMPDFAAYDPDNMLLGRHDGTFKEVGKEAGIALDRSGRGGIISDFNMDGMLDLLVVNRSAPVSLFRNGGAAAENRPAAGPMGNWLQIELSQRGDNRDAIGATINLKTGNQTQVRTVRVGGGHASGHLGFIHFGLGTAERAEVRIKWPDGEWSAPYRVFANNFVAIERGSDRARYWYPLK